MSHLSLPDFAGSRLKLEPPFYFKGMTSSVFPLRADPECLQRFCETYLNIIPPELGHFRAPIPYVYLIMIDYGKMAVPAANLGWFSQREILFCLPLEWYKEVNGRLVFHDWATIAPFIYVDDTLSMATGRRVYGWPKALVNVSPDLTGWMCDPTSATNDVSISTGVFPKAYAGSRIEDRVFLRVRSREFTVGRLPVQLDSPLAPWEMMRNLVSGMVGFAGDAVALMRGLDLTLPLDPMALSHMSQKAAKVLSVAAQGLLANTLNLKQFRRIDRQDEYCYQALTNGPMHYTGFNGGSLLGQAMIGAGDISGGFTIDLVRWPSLSIVETLGLTVDSRSEQEGVEVAHVKPVMPFWYDVDMGYERGVNIAWRTSDGIWHDGEGKKMTSRAAKKQQEDKRFNTTLGSETRVVTGPFQFRGTRARIMPLLARRERVQSYVDALLNTPLKNSPSEEAAHRFEVWGAEGSDVAYVYLSALDYGAVSSSSNDIGDWADLGVNFYIPVRHYRLNPQTGTEELHSVGLFPGLNFADNTTQACTQTEIFGIDTLAVDIDVPKGEWAAEGETRSLLEVHMEILPVLGEGAQMCNRSVLRVLTQDDTAARERMQLTPQGNAYCTILKRELTRKKAVPTQRLERVSLLPVRQRSPKVTGRVLALDFLANGRPINIYALKQFRDGNEPQKACYQALVRLQLRFTNVHGIEEIERPLRVEVSDFASLPIAASLGLIPMDLESRQGAQVHLLEPVGPFEIHCDMEQGAGERLAVRHPMQQWETPEDDSEKPVGAGPWVSELSFELEHEVSNYKPVNLRQTVQDWVSLNKVEGASLEPGAQSVLSMVQSLDPQCVLETILAREWDDPRSTTRWRQARDELVLLMAREVRAWGGGAYRLEKNLKLLAEKNHDVRWYTNPKRSGTIDKLGVLESFFSELVLNLEATEEPENSAELWEKWQERRSDVVYWGRMAALTEDEKKAVREFVRQVQAENDRGARHQLIDKASPAEQQWALQPVAAYPSFAPGLRAEPEGVDESEVIRLRDDIDRCSGVTKQDFCSTKVHRSDVTWVVHRLLRRAYPVAEAWVQRLSDATVLEARKPDHCIPRRIAGAERESVFPLEDCWQSAWYTGHKS